MNRWLWVVISGGCLGLTACVPWTTFQVHGLTPVHPEVSGWRVATVESVTPTFRWEAPAAEPDVRYDLIIYESLGHSWSMLMMLGKEVYYREGLTKPEHQVEEPLRPSTAYYWSVRVRRGGQLSDWSRYDYTNWFFPLFVPVAEKWEWPFFRFMTPKNP